MQTSVAYVPEVVFQGSPVLDPVNRPWERDTISNLASVGVHVDEVEERVRCRAAQVAEAELFELRPATPVFVVARTMFAKGRPVETCDIVMPSDRYELSYRIPVD